MKEWVKKQVEVGNVISLEKIEKETHRVDSLIDYYNGLIKDCTSKEILEHSQSLVSEIKFKKDLQQAKKEIIKKIAGTLFNKLA